MAKFTNLTVIEKFFNGEVAESHTGNLWISHDGKRLMNYATCLVERNAEYGLIINKTKYSPTTSKIQTYIMSALWQNYSVNFINEHVYQISGVDIDTHYLEEDCRAYIHKSQHLLEEVE